MAQDDYQTARDSFDDRPVEKKGSGCWKWLLIFGAIGGVSMLVCCAGVAYLGSMFVPKVVQTAPEVTALAQEITDVTIPEEYAGKIGMKWDNALLSMRLCQFERNDGRGRLQLSEILVKIGDPEQQKAELKKSMNQGGASEMKMISVEESEQREFEIRGEKTTFTFSKGQDVSSQTRYREIRGDFKGKTGLASLHLQVEEELWDDEEMASFIESIK